MDNTNEGWIRWRALGPLPFAAALLTGGLASECAPAPLWLSAGGTQPPRIYLFWQSGWSPLINPAHIPLVADCPPDLFQYARDAGLSRGIPHESMCPAPAEHEIHWSHEKEGGPDVGRTYLPRWWTRGEYQALLEKNRQDVKWVMERTGALGIAPYVCAVKIEGNREARLRFWAFYDHWDQYEEWYGPKPAEDPWEWVQFRFDYRVKSHWAFYKPQRDGSTIHSGCPNSPFSDYLAAFVKVCARSGIRGLFVDNPTSLCICRYCRAAWPKFLESRFDREELKRLFGLDEYAHANIEDPRFEVERRRFWGWSVGRHLARLRAAGEAITGKGAFWICPNGGPIEFAPMGYGCDAVEWAQAGAAQLISRECIRMTEGIDRKPLTDCLSFNALDDLILGHKMMRGFSSTPMWATPLRPHVLLGSDPGFYHLSVAETLAFDGVFADSGAPWLPTEGRKPFHAFYRPLERWLRSGPSVSEVGVLVFTNELHHEPADSVRETRLVTDWLSEARVLWDAVVDDRFAQRDLSGYKVVFVPNVRMLDDDEAAHLLHYARAGGILVLSGEVGTRHRCGVQREAPAFAILGASPAHTETFVMGTYGKGRYLWCPRGFADLDVDPAYTGTDVACAEPARSLLREVHRQAFLDALNRVCGESLSAVLPPGPRALRIAARRFEDEQGTVMTVHLANYDLVLESGRVRYYQVLRGPSRLTPARQVRVAVPVPKGCRAESVQWARYPDPALRPLPFEALADGVSFAVPQVDAYAVAVVRLARGAARTRRTLRHVRGTHTSAEGCLHAIEATGRPRRLSFATEAPMQGLPTHQQVLRVAPGVPIIVSGEAGRDLEILIQHPGQERADPRIWEPLRGFDAASEADRGRVKWLRLWLVGPSGKVLVSGAIPAGQATLLKISAHETGLYALLTEGGPGSLILSTNARALMARARPFESEEPNEHLYFYVPVGIERFKISTSGMDSQARLQIRDCVGQIRFERTDLNVFTEETEVLVPPGESGRVWCLTMTTGRPPGQRTGRRTQFELQPPLEGFVSPDPARLVLLSTHAPHSAR